VGALRPYSAVVSVGLFWLWLVFLAGYGTRALALALLLRASGALRERSKEEEVPCRS
jgi:hypothetical protein